MGWGTIAKVGNTIAVLVVEMSVVGKDASYVEKRERKNGSGRKSHEGK
jgi:hypothetical protein